MNFRANKIKLVTLDCASGNIRYPGVALSSPIISGHTRMEDCEKGNRFKSVTGNSISIKHVRLINNFPTCQGGENYSMQRK